MPVVMYTHNELSAYLNTRYMAFIVYVIDTLGLGKPTLTTKSILLMDILQHIPFYTDKVAIDGQPCFSR